MKKGFFAALLLLAAAVAGAQSDKYNNAMTPKVAAIDTTLNPAALTDLAHAFERIGEAEKTQWLPYYYAALAHVNSGFMMSNMDLQGGLADKIDPIADKAEALIGKAEALSIDNSEIWVVKKMIATLRLMPDPMSRYMQYGPQAQQALEKARQLNPDNPRVYMLEGQDKFFTPEQFGGSKTEARRLLEQALQKYETHKPETALHPGWGRRTTHYFLAQIK